MRFWFLCLCTFVYFGVVLGQDPRASKQRYVSVPAENILLVVAAQPDCPLQMLDSKLLMSADNGEWGVTGLVHNRGGKPIRYFRTSIWTSMGTGGTLNGSDWSSGKLSGNLIMPGQTVRENCEGQITSLTTELREKLKLTGPMRAVAVLIVERIVFDDGSVYSDESTSQALQKYFETISESSSVK
jgi:hypothetical protein